MDVAQTHFLRLHPHDNVAIARRAVASATPFRMTADDEPLQTRDAIELGHKVAIEPIAVGAPIRKYGQIIGFAAKQIQPGDWVHVHNVERGQVTLECAFATEASVIPEVAHARTFLGYRRADGRAATRNYIGILSTVNCSATAAKYVAQRFGPAVLEDFPNIDGVVALTHKMGCAMEYGGEGHQVLARTLAGFARHPNIAAYVVLGLGCETSQATYLVDNYNLVPLRLPGQQEPIGPLVFNIQDEGGVSNTVDRAVKALRQLLPAVNDVQREPIPVSELIVGAECGGSDGYSGITANPAVGAASDLVVAHGGTAMFGEVPEIIGGEHLLTRRAKTREIGESLLQRIQWWKDYVARFDAVIDNNPSVGNKEGGLTTIYEKSLGAISKGGSAPLCAVYEYAQPVTDKGLVIMDTPGFDAISVTGMVAGGAQIMLFTTGRGSCFGCKPVPTIKIATNSQMYGRMQADMDIDAGRVVSENVSVQEVGEEIFEKVVSVASGQKTKSEEQGIGDEEFCPWQVGPIL